MTLTLRNVPDAVHQALKAQALRNRRSVNQEVLAVVEKEVMPAQPSRAEVVAGIIARTDALRAKMKGFMTAEEIDAAIEEGRP
jgi:antitoxin FitA